MGQQQLLLLVLGIVVVGIAIVIGVNAYSENNISANFDALLQDAMRIATDAQTWKTKPELFAGSPDSTKPDTDDFLGVNFAQMSYTGALVSEASLCYSNINGQYGMIPTVTGLTIVATSVPNQNQLELVVVGSHESDISLSAGGGDSIKGGTDTNTGSPATVSVPEVCAGTCC